MQHDRILIVEDDPGDVFLLKRAFQRAKLDSDLFFVGSVDEAIAYLRGKDSYADRGLHPLPVLMLLDLNLPGRSGFEMLSWLREQEGLKRLPVVVLTNSAAANDINRAFDIGANSYLLKNPDPNGFLDLTKALDLYWTLNQRPELSAYKKAG